MRYMHMPCVPELAVARERGSNREALGCATRLVVQTLGHPCKPLHAPKS